VDGDIIQVGLEAIRVSHREVVPPHADEEGITVIKAEQVVVSNLVVDVRGFSGISQRKGSSKVYALIRRIFETFSSIVIDYNGTIKDYVGDAVYAFWDHRFSPSKEQAVLACRAAMEQARTVSSIQGKLSGENAAFENLSLGWGVTTGMVTMSHYGSRAAGMAVVGDSTNLAFRLSDIANKHLPNEIVICSQTAELVGDKLPVLDLGFVSIRGRSGQENVFGIEMK
jgi:class 3 adenylate cyclase